MASLFSGLILAFFDLQDERTVAAIKRLVAVYLAIDRVFMMLEVCFDVIDNLRDEVNAVFASHIVRMAGVCEKVDLYFVVHTSFQEVHIVLHHHHIVVHTVNHEQVPFQVLHVISQV